MTPHQTNHRIVVAYLMLVPFLAFITTLAVKFALTACN